MGGDPRKLLMVVEIDDLRAAGMSGDQERQLLLGLKIRWRSGGHGRRSRKLLLGLKIGERRRHGGGLP